MRFQSLVLTALSAAALSAPALGQAPAIDAAVAEYLPAIVELRHRIHQNPELGNRELETARLVAEHLRGLGLEVATGIAHTGVVALLHNPGATTARISPVTLQAARLLQRGLAAASM